MSAYEKFIANKSKVAKPAGLCLRWGDVFPAGECARLGQACRTRRCQP